MVVSSRRSSAVKVIGGLTAVLGVAALYNRVGTSYVSTASTLASASDTDTKAWMQRSDVQAMQKQKVRVYVCVR